MDARGRDVFKSCRATARTSATAIGMIGTIDGIGTRIVVATIGPVGTIGAVDATARRATTRGDADDRAIGTDEDEDETTVMDGTNARSSEDGRTSGTTRTIAGGGETSERGDGSVDERIRDSARGDAGRRRRRARDDAGTGREIGTDAKTIGTARGIEGMRRRRPRRRHRGSGRRRDVRTSARRRRERRSRLDGSSKTRITSDE